MKSVYSAVRTGSLNKAVCASALEGQYGFIKILQKYIFAATSQVHRLTVIGSVSGIVTGTFRGSRTSGLHRSGSNILPTIFLGINPIP